MWLGLPSARVHVVARPPRKLTTMTYPIMLKFFVEAALPDALNMYPHLSCCTDIAVGGRDRDAKDYLDRV